MNPTADVNTKKMQDTTQVAPELSQDELVYLQEQLRQAQESERRALADYQNLVRRQRDERTSFITYANKELIEGLLEPISHLELAATQLNDTGMNMVIAQFWQKLEEFGLSKQDVLGKPFDVNVMEVAETQEPAEVVVRVHRPALLYNGEVLQHARVVMGAKNTKA